MHTVIPEMYGFPEALLQARVAVLFHKLTDMNLTFYFDTWFGFFTGGEKKKKEKKNL